MVINSINTNSGAMIALQTLNRTNAELLAAQKRVSTGYRVNDAVDDGSAFAVAQGLRSNIASLGAVNQQLNVAKGVVSIALDAATKISDTLIKVRETLTKLADGNLSSTQRSQYNADARRLRAEISNFLKNAVFNGVSLLNSGASDRAVISNVNGELYTIKARPIAQSSLTAAILATNAALSQASAAALIRATGQFSRLELDVLRKLNELGGDSRRINNQINFNSVIMKATEEAMGAMIDADLAKDSARVQALQIKQQLATQTLGVANQAPQVLLGLFR
ncbi:MAG TPA: flagellin [Azospirillaceae bacterium]|nr:flagellin [Azospirillaceae bacterium]